MCRLSNGIVKILGLSWMFFGGFGGATRQVWCDDWAQWRGPGRDGVWHEDSVTNQFSSDRIPHVWSTPIGPGYSGPTVANGRVFLTDRLIEPKQVERVHCFDASTGASLWSHTYDCLYEGIGYQAGPRASVTVQDGRAFALGSMGYLHVFDAESGSLLWMSRLNERYGIEMPVWGITAAPLVYGDVVILHIGGSEGACIVALDVTTGDEIWRTLNDRGSYSAPIVVEQAGQDVVVVWTGDHIVGVSPTSGEVYWQSPLKPEQMVINIATPVFDDVSRKLFVTSFYDGAKMLHLDDKSLTAEDVWRRKGRSEKDTDGLHSIMSTPILQNGVVFGVDSYGELRCLDAKTGERIWEDRTATSNVRWGNIHMVRNGKQVWMFNELGELIISKLSREGFHEISRAKLISPTTEQLTRRGKGVCWSHPAFANRHVYARNDQILVCASLSE